MQTTTADRHQPLATGMERVSPALPSLSGPAAGPPAKVAAFTIISNNYSAHARVLMESLARHQPGWDRWVLLVDLPPADPLVPPDCARTKLATDLPLPGPQTFFTRYDILEANTAVKPWMVEWLWNQGYEWVVYFDPDIRVFSPLVELVEAFSAASIVLTPHITRPYTDDFQPGELLIKRAGVFNLGFVALKADDEGRRTVAWWQGKLAEQCVNAIERGIFVDQSWMNFCPVYCDRLFILKHPGYNVAYWNLHYRPLLDAEVGREIRVGQGVPLRFYHFSGFDYLQPAVLSRHQNRFLAGALSESLLALLRSYAEALRAAGIEKISRIPYALANADIPRAHLAPAFDNPSLRPVFHSENPPPTTAEWRDYLLSADTRNPALPVFLANIWYWRMDLHRVFNIEEPEGLRAFCRWFDETGRKEEKLPADLPAWGWWSYNEQPAPIVIEGRPLVTIYGYLEAVSGVGEAARASVRALQKLMHPHRVVNFSVGDRSTKDRPPYRFSLPACSGAIDLIHVNCDQAGVFLQHHPEVLKPWRYRIGYWAWEKAELPPHFFEHAAQFDELWCLSEANAKVFRSGTNQPVRVAWPNLDLGKIAPMDEVPRLCEFPHGLRYFLALADFHSIPERKGPLNAVGAYLQAFPNPVSGTALVVKIANRGARADYWQKLQEAAAGRPDVVFLTDTLDRSQLNRLIANAHAFVSLHAQEGFGLPIAEAIALKVPVVCTEFGGNLDFCTPQNSHLIPYELIELKESIGPYLAGTFWAQPSLEAAAQVLRQLAEAPARLPLDAPPTDDPVSRRSFEMYEANLAAVSSILQERTTARAEQASTPEGAKILNVVLDRFEERPDRIEVAGWSLLDVPTQASVSTTAVIRGPSRELHYALRRVPRIDVANHFKDAMRLHSGFHGSISLTALPAGSYEIDLLFSCPSGQAIWPSGRSITIAPRVPTS